MFFRKAFRRLYWSLVSLKKVTISVGVSLISACAIAAPNTFQVGTGTIHDTFVNNTFDTFTLAPDFAETPAVFILGNVAGSNSCEVRMQNIGTTSFEAVCAEDSSWDGQHIAVPIQFAAITEGVKTIPTNNGGSVTFEVGCVETNSVQHNCTTGCDTESYENITFSAGFTNPPVVIANIQTVANATLGAPPVNPISPMLSVAIDNITNAGFDLALDLNKEDNVGTLNQEKICWLAVEETSRCDLAGTDDTLNFSAIGGPSSVAFEAIITPDNIDGWDNGCNDTEEATFTPGCFTSTPVAIATKRGRQEPEGWLRYCTLNTGELRITIDEQRVTGQNRQHVDETASVVAFGSSFTTPITLALFKAEQRGGRKIRFQWETESESFNIGFHLWAEVAGEWQQLNKYMIVSQTEGLDGARRYQRTLTLSEELLAQATAFGLSSLDNGGNEEFHGPFELGLEYGEGANIKPIDWTQVRAQYNANMRQAGYVLDHGRWRKLSAKRHAQLANKEYQVNRQVVDLNLTGSGIHRVSYEQLIKAGMVGRSLPLDKLALTYQGQAVPRWVRSEDAVFNQGDDIIFYAPELSPEVALYTQERVYRLQRDPSKVRQATFESVEPVQLQQQSNYHLRSYRLGQNKVYVATSTNGDPWVDRKVITVNGNLGQTEYEFTVNDEVVAQQAQLSISLLGGIDFPSVPSQNPDHHVVVTVNGAEVINRRFDGFQGLNAKALLPLGLIKQGQNSVVITLPGDTGQIADLIHIDEVVLKVPHANEFNGQQLIIPSQKTVDHYQVSSVTDNVQLFAYQANGNFAVLNGAQQIDDGLRFAALPNLGSKQVAYALVTGSGYVLPESIQVKRLQNPLKSHAKSKVDYWVIAHPAFINKDLERFVNAKRQFGYNVAIVDWLDLVDTYGYGMPTPGTIRRFLKQAQAQHPFDHVLIVGGHSYDYHDYLGNGNINFIPTEYQAVKKDFSYAPTDALLVDLDEDGLPDKAIGRWPVRAEQDVKHIVNKTLQWQKSSHLYRDKTLLIADVSDESKQQFFAQQLQDFAKQGSLLNDPNQIERIYLDDYLATHSSSPVSDAKADLLNLFSSSSTGVGMTVFNGHSSTSRWTFRNLFNVADVGSMNNVDAPTLVLPLACYTTMYELPSVNTLAHQLLFQNEAGAAAISGATYLSEYRENAEFSKRVLEALKKQNTTLGLAILEAKRGLMPWNDMVTNWSLLGDPSLVIIEEK